MHILKILTALAVPALLSAPAVNAAENKYPEKPIRLTSSAASLRIDCMSPGSSAWWLMLVRAQLAQSAPN
jgi:hypothetical protein